MRFNSIFFFKRKALDFFCESFILNRILRKVYYGNIFSKKKAGSYVGLRLTQRLPSRGQRTHTNGFSARSVIFPTYLYRYTYVYFNFFGR
jgi:hypothetical protein